MRKLCIIFLLLLVLCTLCTNIIFAQSYTYFDILNTEYPHEKVSADNVVYVNKVYYMSDKDGGLYYSHNAKSWNFIDGSDGARVISDKKKISDALIVFYNGYLVESYDGANFNQLYKFLPDTVVRFENGIYTAFEKTISSDSSGFVYLSFDAHKWFKLTNEKVLDGHFTIDKYADMIIVNGINTQKGKICAVVDYNAKVTLLSYDSLFYDNINNIFAATKKDNNTLKLYYSNALGNVFKQLSLPDALPTHASYYDGSFYIATVYEDNFFDVYKCSDTSKWNESDRFYMPLYKPSDGKDACEAYLWHTTSSNAVGLALIKTDGNGEKEYSSVFLSSALKPSIYGDIFAITSSEKPMNLICADNALWHQIDDEVAFSVLNLHNMRGDYLFVDSLDNSLVFPKGDVFEKIGQKGIEVQINGEYIAFDSPPTIINSRTLVPLRAIAEAIGASVNYEESSKKITIEYKGNTILMTVGASTAQITYYDGAIYEPTLDCPSQIINDRTLVPVRFIGESFGLDVGWKEDTKTVLITSK